jgi:hypothetical protein
LVEPVADAILDQKQALRRPGPVALTGRALLTPEQQQKFDREFTPPAGHGPDHHGHGDQVAF